MLASTTSGRPASASEGEPSDASEAASTASDTASIIPTSRPASAGPVSCDASAGVTASGVDESGRVPVPELSIEHADANRTAAAVPSVRFMIVRPSN
jgi:hypothetical protein